MKYKVANTHCNGVVVTAFARNKVVSASRMQICGAIHFLQNAGEYPFLKVPVAKKIGKNPGIVLLE
jgi:hypothetical protein